MLSSYAEISCIGEPDQQHPVRFPDPLESQSENLTSSTQPACGHSVKSIVSAASFYISLDQIALYQTLLHCVVPAPPEYKLHVLRISQVLHCSAEMFCSPIKWIGSLTKFHCAAMFCVGSLFCKLLLHGQVAAGVLQMHLGLHLVWKLLLQVTAAESCKGNRPKVQRQPSRRCIWGQSPWLLSAHLYWASALLNLKLKMSATLPERPQGTKDEVQMQPTQRCIAMHRWMHWGPTTSAAHLYQASAQSSITLSIVFPILVVSYY